MKEPSPLTLHSLSCRSPCILHRSVRKYCHQLWAEYVTGGKTTKCDSPDEVSDFVKKKITFKSDYDLYIVYTDGNPEDTPGKVAVKKVIILVDKDEEEIDQIKDSTSKSSGVFSFPASPGFAVFSSGSLIGFPPSSTNLRWWLSQSRGLWSASCRIHRPMM